jgi:hypothetical protein
LLQEREEKVLQKRFAALSVVIIPSLLTTLYVTTLRNIRFSGHPQRSTSAEEISPSENVV